MKTADQIIKTHKGNIKTVKDVKAFLGDLNEFGLNEGFHPDTAFADYIGGDKGNFLFSKKNAYALDLILGDCFKVCDKNKKDIYEICNKLFDSKQTKNVKKAFDKEVSKTFDLAESLEANINKKMKTQTQDSLSYKHYNDLKEVNKLLERVNELLTSQ